MNPAHVPKTDSDKGEPPARRIGFWLGLVLFAALLILPPPASMRRAVRQTYQDQIPLNVAALLGASNGAPAGPESAEYRQTEDQVVAHRAKVMQSAAAVTALVACWWITVAIPIPVTSLLPLVLLPLVGVIPIKQAAVPYANPNVFLFMGGFIIALGIERWGLHRRIALHIVSRVGTSRSTIVLGFMLASAFLSMWISNTATALMMLPIGLAIISAMGELSDEADQRQHGNFAAALMLGIAYSASIGGVATPIGTPPNISFRGQFTRLFPDAPEISFGQWTLTFLPLVVVFLPVVWLVLVRITCPVGKARLRGGREVISKSLLGLGPMRSPERRVLFVFAATALLWMTRSIPINSVNYGWSGCLERWLAPDGLGIARFQAAYINDATVALGMAVLLFMIPAGHTGKQDDGRRNYLMNWETAKRLPWGILLLFGGGFAIAGGFRASGLSFWCGQVFAGSGMESPLIVVVGVCLLMTFLTEITSNTATSEVMLPILAGVSVAVGVNPLMLMLPATISASCAFMLPVATPPNAIIFGSGCVDMGRMVRTGLILNLIGVGLITGTFYLIAKPMLGIELGAMPSWAN
ncbi:MAG: SLC13/DASS family transporter [bacterium]|nr:SLC13/DASS family transporter [bacterium]